MVGAHLAIVRRDAFGVPIDPGGERRAGFGQRGEFGGPREQPIGVARRLLGFAALREIDFGNVARIERRNAIDASAAVAPRARKYQFAGGHRLDRLEVARIGLMDGQGIKPGRGNDVMAAAAGLRWPGAARISRSVPPAKCKAWERRRWRRQAPIPRRRSAPGRRQLAARPG